MATADHDSSLELRVRPELTGPASSHVADEEQPIWLDGDVLACACPDCGAPMSIRLWLKVADCWRCGTSVELTDQQEREALRLLRQRDSSRRAETREAARAINPTMMRPASGESRRTGSTPPPPATAAPRAGALDDRASPKPQPRPGEAPATTSSSSSSPPSAKRLALGRENRPAGSPPPKRPAPPALPSQVSRRRPAAVGIPHRTRRRIGEMAEHGTAGFLWSDFFRNFPAWLASLVFHLAALLLLSLFMMGPGKEPSAITLSTSMSPHDSEGDLGELEELEQPVEFEDPGALPVDEMAVLDFPGESDLEFETVIPMSNDLLGDLDELRDVTESVVSAGASEMFAGRDPELRAQIALREGGTEFTEAAVTRGLEWLARHQNSDGSWSLDRWHQAPGAAGIADGVGDRRNDVAATALGLLPFLGAGETHRRGKYSDTVYKGLRWLLAEQREDGDLRGNWGSSGRDITRMYAHGQAAIVLSEAYALTGDQEFREPARRALGFIVDAQHSEGGWRYRPGERGDTSVLGWQIMALRSGVMAYLPVPQQTFRQANRYLERAQADRYGGLYSYQPGGRATPTMTAEALLCRQYLGWPHDHRGLKVGVSYLLNHPPDRTSPNIYYWYYATQVMHHYGGKPWNQWNARIRNVLVDMQRTDGHLAGSWDPRGGHASSGGRVYMTSLAVCTLEVYYRHIPLYRDSEIELLGFGNEPDELRGRTSEGMR